MLALMRRNELFELDSWNMQEASSVSSEQPVDCRPLA
jgi:hypothetical protein